MRTLIATIASALLLIAGCSGPDVETFGVDLYSSSCAHCHGSDLAGGVTDRQIMDVVRIGPGAMTSFGDRFSQAQLDSLVDYLRSEQGA